MLLSYGVNAVGGVVSGMGDAIGISDLTLGTQGEDDTQVTIGGNINSRLRVDMVPASLVLCRANRSLSVNAETLLASCEWLGTNR